jgi:hypothetical protein
MIFVRNLEHAWMPTWSTPVITTPRDHRRTDAKDTGMLRVTQVGIFEVPTDSTNWLLAHCYHTPVPPKPPQEKIVEEEFPILDADGDNLEALVTLPVRHRVLRPTARHGPR